MRTQRAAVGYRTGTALRSNVLMPAGARIVGHEFHYSELRSPTPEAETAYALTEAGRTEGYASGATLASYVHLHFGSDPDLAKSFVSAASAVSIGPL